MPGHTVQANSMVDREMKRIVSASLLLCALSGCMTTRDGLLDQKGMITNDGGLQVYRRELNEPRYQVAPKYVERVLLVGHVGVLTRFDTEEEKARGYSDYLSGLTTQRQVHRRAIFLSRQEFFDNIGGVVSVDFFRAGLYTLNTMALVPKNLMEQIHYPSFLSSLFSGKGDLVGATTNLDGVFIIASRLCAKDNLNCTRDYTPGLFREGSGVQIDRHLQAMQHGATIDPDTYKVASR
jgi:hypothetical protein